jgi:hypothetical protein
MFSGGGIQAPKISPHKNKKKESAIFFENQRKTRQMLDIL